MLTRAVSDDDEDTEGTAKILDGLSLTRSGGSSGCTTVTHTEGLSESNVASFREGRDTESLLGTKEFVLISEIDISDRNDGLAVLAILSAPVEARILGPVEVGNVTDATSEHVVVDSLEKILLVDLDGNEGLDLGTDELVRQVVTTHVRQIVHDAVNLGVLLLEGLLAVTLALKALSDFLGENELDSEQGNLRLVFVDEVLEVQGEALSGSILANAAHRILHGSFELAEPVLNVAFTLDVVVEFDGLSSTTPVLVDRAKKSAVNAVEGNSANSIEHLFEVILDLAGVSSDRQNLQQISVRTEVETREDTSLLLKISLKLTLAVLEILLHLGEGTGQKVVLAARNDELLLSNALHDLLPLSVRVLEDLGSLRHLLGNLTTGEDEHETHPLGHHLEPFLKSLLHRREGVKLGLNFGPEGSDAAGSEHLNEVHHVVFQLLLVFGNRATDCAREVVVLVRLNRELSSRPIFIDILTELLLDLHLLVGRVTDVLNIFLDGEQVSIEQVLQEESLRGVGNLLSGQLNELLPMALLDYSISEHVDEREHNLHVIKALLEFLVGGVLLGVRGQTHAILKELLNSVLHASDLIGNLEPWGILPLGDSLSDLQVEGVEFVEFVKLVLSLDERGVFLVGQGKQLLTSVVRLVFTVVDGELLFEVFEFVQSLARGEVSLHRAVLLEIFAEHFNLDDKSSDVLNQLLLELGLFVVERITHGECLLDELIPLFLEVFALIHLVTVHIEGVLDEGVHVSDRFELEVDVRLLLADLFEGEHNAAKGVNILDFLVDLEADLLDIVSEVGEELLCLLVDVLAEDHFPLKDVSGESLFHALRLEGEGTNLVSRLNLLNLGVLVVEFLELLLKLFETGVLVAELLEVILGLLGPQP